MIIKYVQKKCWEWIFSSFLHPINTEMHIITFAIILLDIFFLQSLRLSAEFNKNVEILFRLLISTHNHVLDYHVRFYVFFLLLLFSISTSLYQMVLFIKRDCNASTTNPFLCRARVACWNYWINFHIFHWLLIYYIRLLIYSSWHWCAARHVRRQRLTLSKIQKRKNSQGVEIFQII